MAAAESIPPVQLIPSSHPTIALIWRRAAIGLALLFACACLLGTEVVTAASDALPNSPFYPVKLATEDAWLWVAPARSEPALHVRFARRRLAEVEEAQKRIVEVIRNLEENGTITIGKGSKDAEMVP